MERSSHAIKLTETPRRSRDGWGFTLSSSSWQLNKDVSLSLRWVSKLNVSNRQSYLEVLAYYAQNYSADHARNMNTRSSLYFSSTGDSEFNIDSMISYRGSLKKSTEHYLGALRGFVRKWHELGYVGVSDELIALLNGWVLKGNEKGRAVSLLDDKRGPFSDVEMEALLDKMLDGYICKRISLQDYSIASILAHSGRRPGQIVGLKIKDLICHKCKDIERFAINFPRAKQRGGGWRQHFNTYLIVGSLWSLLDLQRKSVIKRIELKTRLTLAPSIIRELPLFPELMAFGSSMEEQVLKYQLGFDFLHGKRGICQEALNKISASITVFSERTGEQLSLDCIRFRYTLGTNLAREGKGEYVIAEALDHSDVQNAGVYVSNIPDIVECIDKAVAMQLAPLAQAFQGILIVGEREAKRGDDKTSRISNGEHNLGNCGNYSFCGALAPVACYTCTYFQPWLNGPHEMVLDELIAKRDSVLRSTEDLKIASINDRLILAVSDVVLRCREARAKISV